MNERFYGVGGPLIQRQREQSIDAAAYLDLVAVKSLLQNKYWVTMFFAMLCIFFVIIFYSIGGVYYALYIFNDMNQVSWMNNAISVAQFAIMCAVICIVMAVSFNLDKDLEKLRILYLRMPVVMTADLW